MFKPSRVSFYPNIGLLIVLLMTFIHFYLSLVLGMSPILVDNSFLLPMLLYELFCVSIFEIHSFVLEGLIDGRGSFVLVLWYFNEVVYATKKY